MSTPFDATTKVLVETYPEDWIRLLGLPPGEVTVIDSDLATVSTEADKGLRVEADPPYVAHFEFQTGDTTGLPVRGLRYNVVYREKTGLIVVTTIVLFRPATRHQEVTGHLVLPDPFGNPAIEFHYNVIRVWEEPPERFLQGGIGVAPLALLARGGEAEATQAMKTIIARAEAELGEVERRKFYATTFVLSGLKHSEQFLQQLFQGVLQMRESVTYQAILREGREEGREEGRSEATLGLILRQGRKRFGEPKETTIEQLSSRPLQRLELLAERLLEVETWEELLA